MYFFYAEDVSYQESVCLNKDESKHCTRSLRKKNGDKVFVTNGKGNLFEAEVVDDNMNQTILLPIQEISSPFARNYHLRMAVSPLKNPDRFEWFVEKAVEIGVDEIIPIICHRTEKSVLKMDRLNRIAMAAMKQSMKTILPRIYEPQKISDFLKTTSMDETKLMAWCETSKEVHIGKKISNSKKLTILIGPEGDFTKEEVDLAISKSFIPISLGASRFRSETAAVLACHHVFLADRK